MIKVIWSVFILKCSIWNTGIYWSLSLIGMHIITDILRLNTTSRRYRYLLNWWTKVMRCLMNISILWSLLKHSALLATFDLICILLTFIVYEDIWLLLDIGSGIVISISNSWLLSAKMRTLMMSLLLLNKLLLLDGSRNNASAASDGWVGRGGSVHLISIILGD
jgi:hypothetical protein